MDHGRLVAAIMKSFPFWAPMPSIWVKNSFFTLLEESFSPSPLLPQIESISSIKMIEGWFFHARSKSPLTSFSDSPWYLLMRSAEETEKNLALAIVAQALAKNVLPVPGGPYSKIPFHGLVFFPVKMKPNCSGITRASCSIFFGTARPAISSSYTLGLS